ncbi:sensor TorS domain protein, partial [Vibrio parahaemolyticus V-223/04]
MPEVFSIW